MPEACAICGKTFAVRCKYCGKKFCSEHKRPDKHSCAGLEKWREEEKGSSYATFMRKMVADSATKRRKDEGSQNTFPR